MTLTSAVQKEIFDGNGSTVVFAIPFTFDDNSHVVAIHTTVAGVESTLVEDTDYTISGTNLTMSTAPATGERLTLYRHVPLTQLVDFTNQEAYFLENTEFTMDRLMMAVQQIEEVQNRSIEYNISVKPGEQVSASDFLAYVTAAGASAAAAEASETASAASAAAALASETAAGVSETAAAASGVAAALSKTAAETAETNAETAETNAETAETAAELAETNAAASAAAAALSKTAAELAETNAETAETNAETAETNAETAETNAETAETNAAASAAAAAASAAIIGTVTAAEMAQVGNIDTVTISNAQWGYLGSLNSTQWAFISGLNQALMTSSNVTFNQITGSLQTGAQPNITSLGTLVSLAVSGTATVNTINEYTAGAGVTIDGVLLKDGEVDGVSMSSVNILAKASNVQAKENGIQLIEDGAIYTFDDWYATDIMTGSYAKPVPYKDGGKGALSNGYTGYESIGYVGNGGQKSIYPAIGMGLHWVKNRGGANQHQLMDLLQDSKFAWASADTTASTTKTTVHTITQTGFSYGFIGAEAAEVNALSNDYIVWNWSYPCAKAWAPAADLPKKVPTPWGVLDAVAANGSSGLTTGQVIIEVYNPLTGNGALHYIGTGVARRLDIAGGITPGFVITKVLSTSGYGSYVYHSQLNGGTNPKDEYLTLLTAAGEVYSTTAWGNTANTSTLLSIGSDASVNVANHLCVAYYFAPVAGLQAFGEYTGNTPNAPTVGTLLPSDSGCKDGMFFAKTRNASAAWYTFDDIRGNKSLNWNSTATENADAGFAWNAISGVDLTNSTGVNNISSGYKYIYGHFGKEMVIQGDTDSYITTPVSGNGTNSSIQVTFELETSMALNTVFEIHVSRKTTTPDWEQASLAEEFTLSNGRKQIKATVDMTSTDSGDDLRWRVVTAEGSSFTEYNIYNFKIIGV